MTEPDLFDGIPYPGSPGWKVRDTSRQATEAIAPKAPPLRIRVLQAIRDGHGTPEAIAKRLGVPVMNVRPRTSELSALGLIEDSGRRGPAMGGRRAIIWMAVAQQ